MYRRGIADQHIGFAMVGVNGAVTGEDVTVYRVVDNGDQEEADGIVEEKGNGQYIFTATADDLDGWNISLLFVSDNAFPIEKTIVTTAADPGDGDSFGLTNLDTPLSNVLGQVILTIETPSADITDVEGNHLSEITAAQALAALVITMTGDRDGIGTREIIATLPGVADCNVTAVRSSRSLIEATIVVPTS